MCSLSSGTWTELLYVSGAKLAREDAFLPKIFGTVGRRFSSNSPLRIRIPSFCQRLHNGPWPGGKRNVDPTAFAEEAARIRLTISKKSEVHPGVLPEKVNQFAQPGTA